MPMDDPRHCSDMIHFGQTTTSHDFHQRTSKALRKRKLRITPRSAENLRQLFFGDAGQAPCPAGGGAIDITEVRDSERILAGTDIQSKDAPMHIVRVEQIARGDVLPIAVELAQPYPTARERGPTDEHGGDHIMRGVDRGHRDQVVHVRVGGVPVQQTGIPITSPVASTIRAVKMSE